LRADDSTAPVQGCVAGSGPVGIPLYWSASASGPNTSRSRSMNTVPRGSW